METRVFCVYNLTRRVFLSSKVTVADWANQPLTVLKVMISGLALDSESGLWLTPVNGTPSLPRLFPFDLAYLDKDNRVLETVEVLPGDQLPPHRPEVASAVALPPSTFRSTQTKPGDQLTVCLQQEADEVLTAVDIQPAVMVKSNPAPVIPGPEPVAPGSLEQSDSTPAAAAKTPSVSITEVVFERPHIPGPLPIAEHRGGVEDLFANWVESPAAPTAWIVQNTQPSAAKMAPAVTGTHADSAPAQTPPIEVATATPASAQTAAEGVPDEVVNAAGEIDASVEKAIEPGRETANSAPTLETPAQPAQAQAPVTNPSAKPKSGRRGTPAQVPPPVKAPIPVTIPQPAQTVAFTVAQYGMWQVSSPTAATPIVSMKLPAADDAVDRVPVKGATASLPAKRGDVREPEVPISAEADHLSVASEPVSTQAKPQERDTRDSAPQSKIPPAVEAAVEKQDPVVVPVAGKTQPAPPKLETTPAKTAPHWPKERRAEPALDSAQQPAKAKAPETEHGSDWRTDKIVEATGKRVPAEFAAAVEDRLERLLTKPAPGSTDLPAPTASSALDKKTPAAKPALPAKSEPAVAANTSSAPKPAAESSAKPADKNEAADRQNELSMTVPIPAFLKPDQKGKLKISIQRVESNGKNGKPAAKPAGLGTRFMRWLNPEPQLKSDRRRAHRRYVPGMVAHYFTGGAPKPYEVADISMTGFYLLTQDRWMPDTMIQMTLQKPCAKRERKQSIHVLSRVVRRGSDGVAAEFVMAESLNPHSRDILPSQATDRFSLARFL